MSVAKLADRWDVQVCFVSCGLEETSNASKGTIGIMKLALVLVAFLMRLQQAHLSSESETQSSSDDLLRVVMDSNHDADKRRGWGKRSLYQDEETPERSALQEGETLDSNESVIFDLIKRRGWGKRATNSICEQFDSELSVEKRKGWGKRDHATEKRRGWGKREFLAEKRRGWGKRDSLFEKRRGWGKRELAEKRRGWGKRDFESISSALEMLSQGLPVTDDTICSALLKNWYYHSCLAFKVTLSQSRKDMYATENVASF